MPDPDPTATDSSLVTVAASATPGALRWVRSLATPGEAFGLPANAVRAMMTFALVLTYLWLQWNSPTPEEFKVPPALIAAVGLVTGFYLTGDASPTMKALLSLIYVLTMSAFMLRFGWVPESVNTQVTTCLGIYFAKRAGLPNGGEKP